MNISDVLNDEELVRILSDESLLAIISSPETDDKSYELAVVENRRRSLEKKQKADNLAKK